MLAPRQARSTPSKKRYSTLIIGAGYTGLAAARRIAELKPDEEILIIEASTVGEGASGRNSGFLINMPHGPFAHDNGETAMRQLDLFSHGLNWLSEIVSRHAIACDWRPTGKFHGARTKTGIANLRATLKQYRQWGIACDELDTATLHCRIGTPYYQYGFIAHNNVFVQPAALIRGLADALPPNVYLTENAPVTHLDEGDVCTVYTHDATYQADKVIIASNGLATRLGYLKDRVISMYTYAALTPVLPADELAKLGTDEVWGLIPASRVGSTLRRLDDGRFMVRSGYNYGREASPESVEKLLTSVYRRRYPDMRSYQFDAVWGGTTALTRNGSNVFGALRKNLFAYAGCNGTGVLKGTTYGRLLGELAAGVETSALSQAMAMTRANWLPPEPIRRVAVSVAIAYQRALTQAEQ